jgi:hypothetical protein
LVALQKFIYFDLLRCKYIGAKTVFAAELYGGVVRASCALSVIIATILSCDFGQLICVKCF